MNARIRPEKPEYVLRQTPKLKTLNLNLSVSEEDLAERVRRAFELAKSSGHELDLTFRPQAS